MLSEIILPVLISSGLSLTGTLVGIWASNKKTTALIMYRIEQLEKKVDKHNGVIERTYELEKRTEMQELRLDESEKRIDRLEKG